MDSNLTSCNSDTVASSVERAFPRAISGEWSCITRSTYAKAKATQFELGQRGLYRYRLIAHLYKSNRHRLSCDINFGLKHVGYYAPFALRNVLYPCSSSQSICLTNVGDPLTYSARSSDIGAIASISGRSGPSASLRN